MRLPGKVSCGRSCPSMSSRASHKRAGQATRKRVKASCCQRHCSVVVVGGLEPRGRFLTSILGPPTLLNHVLSQMPTPRPQQPLTPVRDGQYPECEGKGRRGTRATEQGEGRTVLSGTLAHTFCPSVLPTSCLPSVRWKSPEGGHPERSQQLTPLPACNPRLRQASHPPPG